MANRSLSEEGSSEWTTGVSRAVGRLMEEVCWSQESTIRWSVPGNDFAWSSCRNEWRVTIWNNQHWKTNNTLTACALKFSTEKVYLNRDSTWLFQAGIRLRGTLKANASLFSRQTGTTFDDLSNALDSILDQLSRLWKQRTIDQRLDLLVHAWKLTW